MRRTVTIGAGLLVAGIFATGPLLASQGTERYEADLASSRVTIEGASTLHDWHAEGHHLGGHVILQDGALASLWENSDPPLQSLAPTGQVEIPVTSLTSGKRGMDDNMHKALKAAAHPMITYRLESATITGGQAAHAEDARESRLIDTTGVLTVAGIEQTVGIPMRIRRLPDHCLEVSGNTVLHMTEFGIDPPTAMLGTIRTGDTVRVHWVWVLAQRPTSDER